jgi:maltooligosyltrehalose trehalohydrolase
MSDVTPRRLPIGAEPIPGGVHFRVWAPRRRTVEVVVEGGPTKALTAEGNGYFSGPVAETRAGSCYRYRVDGEGPFPDPASRFQPDGPHGPSEVIDPRVFCWSDNDWHGVALPGQILYELHLGTFTPEGTYESATRRLPDLVDLGVTVVEIMPVADYPGHFGWGYDGVNMYAPTRLHGRPDDLRRFIDTAHRLGLAVILDVVYNHIGPDGNYLSQFSKDYFTDRHKTDWGPAINYDGPSSGPVREFFVSNGAYWIDEFHFDGLRLDATQSIVDESRDHVLAELARRTRAAAAGRSIVLIAENEAQDSRLARSPEKGGYGLDAQWNDDYHHTARVAMTGRNEAYYFDYRGTPQEFISALKYGYLYQGQRYAHQNKRRGTPGLDLDPAAFVVFLQNHDQVSNSGLGWRIQELTSPGRLRALTALTLLAPGTPLLFQGQEFASSRPFLFFAHHKPELARLVRKGRGEFMAQFPSMNAADIRALLPDPADPATFERCKLDWSERERHAPIYALHRDLIRLRRTDPVFRLQRKGGIDGAVLGEQAFALRYLGDGGDDRLLLVNLGRTLDLAVVPEPLLAPPEGRSWHLLWSSEDIRYGTGTALMPENAEGKWILQGECAVVLAAR